MFMVEAIKSMDAFTNDKLEEISIETALLAKGGISPMKSDLLLKSIPGRAFKGLQLLSY